MANRLELTWYEKEKPILIEPRILLERVEFSNTDTDPETENMLIHGDNLLALKALEKDYTGRIKCIYIDPPYNTGSAFENYDDNLEHSLWLRLMKPRLEILHNLLSSDGLLAVQIDDNEYAHLYLLMCEIFGRQNLKTICIQMSQPTGVKMASVNNAGSIAKLKEYIILAKKDGVKGLDLERVPKSSWDSEYKIYCNNVSDTDLERIKSILADENRTNEDIGWIDNIASQITFTNINTVAQNEIGRDADDEWCFKNASRIIRDAALTGGARDLAVEKKLSYGQNVPSSFSIQTAQRKMYLIKGDFNHRVSQPRCKILFADQYLTVHPGDLWTDIKTTGLGNEGTVDFRNGKKPERLIYRIIKMNTKPGDIVLDSFLGSGTTAAVAHKMGRKWIGIELYEQCYTHCIPRLNAVINGTDTGGVTTIANWQGGGGYRVYELAPTLINKDAFGESVINKNYSADMLASAVALHEGFTYQPDKNLFWKQSVGSEKSYLFVTTRHLTKVYLDSIKNNMQDDEYLVIACCSYASGLDRMYNNIAIKKIPQILLDRCEFGKNDYSLKIIHPPVYEDEEEYDAE